jgi:TonB family protein
MKPIKIFCLLLILFCPLYGSENKNIEDYFLKIHANEKLEFLECVKKEDASPAQKVNTKCEISSEAKDAVFILYNKEVQTLFSFLDQFTQYKRTNEVVPQYPRMAQEKGTECFAIVKYSISKEGTVLDPKIIEGKCGDRRSPFTKFESCNVFNKEALRAVKKFKYEPVKFEGRKIKKNNVSHSFTFLMEEEYSVYSKEKSNFKGALAMINLYYGISFISIGDIHKGAYYLGIASKNAASKEQLDYINNVIDQISIYL